MTIKIDETCNSILKALIDGPQDFAGLQRKCQIGSYLTVKTHVNHLMNVRLVEDNPEKKGTREFHSVKLTDKGRRYITSS